MPDLLLKYWQILVAIALLAIHVVLTCHAILHKKDTRAAIGWIGLLWLSPGFGALAYVMFGINRLHRKARRMGAGERNPASIQESDNAAQLAREAVGERGVHFSRLAILVGEVTRWPLLYGNKVDFYRRGDDAYPAMIDAIDQAENSIALCSYIFDRDRAGKMFLDALKRAVKRGVQVRVLIDGVGSSYSFPSMPGLMRKAGVTVAKFNSSLLPTRFVYRNLRNHRKILVTDGRIGFTGGMNIREGHLLELESKHPILDAHFRLRGPVVSHLMDAFETDWRFSTGETLEDDSWHPEIPPAGTVLARGISDGPDEDLDAIRMTILGGIACASTSILIITPYFLPDDAVLAALGVAALRGVNVDILLPAHNNMPIVHWASIPLQRRLLEHGCRVWLSPPPFDHTKLMVVDDGWTLLGSANMDPRSLRLNFEFNVECYSDALANEVADFIREKITRSHAISIEEIDARSLITKLRDGTARLASPYL